MHKLAFILLIIGGLNWLLVGILDWGIGNLFSDSTMWIAKVIYILVGLSALYELFTHKGRCKDCVKGSAMGGSDMGMSK